MKYAVYAWIIDKDHIDAGHDDGLIGPRNVNPLLENALKTRKDCGEKFKMYDDDGELYYSGRILLNLALVEDRPDDFDETEFAPLDDFGMPGAGCTEIRYWNAETKTYRTI